MPDKVAGLSFIHCFVPLIPKSNILQINFSAMMASCARTLALDANRRSIAQQGVQPEVQNWPHKKSSYAVFASVLAASKPQRLTKMVVIGSEQFAQVSRAPWNYSYQAQDPARRYGGLAAVAALHLLLAWALLSGTVRKGLEILKKPLEAVVIQEVIIPPAAPPPPPKEIRPPEPLAPKVATPPPTVQPDAPAPSANRPMETEPREAVPVTPVVSPVAAPPVVAVPPALPADTLKPKVASLEGEYVGKVRAMLNATKRYPTGRQASQQRPHGRVKVWFTLSRAGTLVDAGVLESSNSNLLDDAALASVRRGTYPPFPTNTWPGQEQHKFSADIEFSPPSAG